MEFLYSGRVYFSDTDAGGRVYHARYLDWAEHARTEMLRAIIPSFSQQSLSELDFGFVVKSINIEYLKPGKLDDEILVKTKVVSSGSVSVLLEQKIEADGSILAVMKVKVAFINLKTNHIEKLPVAISEALKS